MSEPQAPAPAVTPQRGHRHDRFPRVGRLHRGYHCRQVEAFLARVEKGERGESPQVTAGEVRLAGFELVRHGYQVAAVDARLDELEERAVRGRAGETGKRGRYDVASEVADLVDELAAPYMKRFPRAGSLHRGYDVDDVDELTDRIRATLKGTDDATFEDVRVAAFRPRRGGYDEDAVDDALDRVVELMLVLQRTEAAPAPGSEDTVSRARSLFERG